MSYSPYFKGMCERKHEGQPHYERKWKIKNAKPTGLTDAQLRVAAPPDGGWPASPIYAFFDISQLKPDWEPGMLQIVERPELGTEYAKLDNGFWYLLEEDGSYKHMTDREFEEFLAWKMDHEAVEEEDTIMEEWKEEDEELLAEFDAAEETINSSLELLNSEIEALDAELEAVDSELEGSNQNSDSDEEVADEDEAPQPKEEPKFTARRWRKTETLFDEFGRLDTLKSWRRKHCSQPGRLQQCHWQMIRGTDRWARPQTKPGVPKLTVTTPEGLCFWLHDPINYNYRV